MPRYSISNAPTEVVGLYAGSGVFRERLGDISIAEPRPEGGSAEPLLVRFFSSLGSY